MKRIEVCPKCNGILTIIADHFTASFESNYKGSCNFKSSCEKCGDNSWFDCCINCKYSMCFMCTFDDPRVMKRPKLGDSPAIWSFFHFFDRLEHGIFYNLEAYPVINGRHLPHPICFYCGKGILHPDDDYAYIECMVHKNSRDFKQVCPQFCYKYKVITLIGTKSKYKWDKADIDCMVQYLNEMDFD